MTILHKSTLAMRRLAFGHQSKRTYTQLSHPVNRISEGSRASASTNSKMRSDTWILIPTVIALFGLGFSTFSTHQLMCCHSNNVQSSKEP